MESKRNIQIDNQFDPDVAFKQIIKLTEEFIYICDSKEKGVNKRMKEIQKEVDRLSKLKREYYKIEADKFKKKQKE